MCIQAVFHITTNQSMEEKHYGKLILPEAVQLLQMAPQG